ncbi:MAG TPA: hypothetical protein VN682_16910 [Terriglobales bacterium]|nr:hypothetical protein [Terriglobales bacterium]
MNRKQMRDVMVWRYSAGDPPGVKQIMRLFIFLTTFWMKTRILRHLAYRAGRRA